LDNGVFVDPVVSKQKFDSEAQEWRKRAAEHGRRGIVLVDDNFPKAFATFSFPSIRPAHLLFGVHLDFTNYDIWPPSVIFADPLSREPWPNGMSTPMNVVLGTAVLPLFLRFRTDPANPSILIPEQAVICQGNNGPAFLCMRGIREYHEHPAHSGDSWLQYRGSGVGSLFYVLDKLHEFGISHIAGMRIGLQYVSGGQPQIVPSNTPGAGSAVETGD
jgi:Predicted metal binding domain